MSNKLYLKSLYKPTLLIDWLLAVAAIVMLVLIACNSYFWLDDFMNGKGVREMSLFSRARWMFMEWDGRAFSPFYLLGDLCDAYLAAESTALLTSFFHFFSSFLLVMLLGRLLFEATKISNELILLSFFVAFAVWLGMAAHLSRSFYWVAGSKYFNSHLLVVLFFWLLFQKKPLFLVCISAFLVAYSGINLSAGILSFFVLLKLFRVQPFEGRRDVFIFGALLAGALLTTMAPGNFVRAAARNEPMDFSMAGMISGYLTVFKEYMLMSKWLVVGAIVSAITFMGMLKNRTPSFELLTFKLSLVFLFSALATIVPFSPLPAAASKHTAHFFQFLFFLSVLCGSFWALSRFNFSYAPAARVLFPVFVSFFIYKAWVQYQIGIVVKQQITKRYQYLESKRGTTDSVFIQPIPLPDHFFTNRFWETTDNSDWGFKVLQEQFGTGPVVLKQ